jgi:hypothetical protein
MMGQDKITGSTIQALPIHKDTYISPDGGMTGYTVTKESVVHCLEDGELTFDFGMHGTKTVPAIAGMDYALGGACQEISSTAKVIVS